MKRPNFGIHTRMRYYAVVLITSLVSMVAATGVIYAFVRGNLIARSVQDTTDDLRSVMSEHASVFEQADAALCAIAVNKDIVNLPKLIDSGAYTRGYRSYTQMEAIVRQYDFVDYISVYDLKKQRVTATRWGLSSIHSYSREQIPVWEDKRGGRGLQIDVLRETPGGETQPTLRTGRFFPIGYLDEPETFISMTLDTNALKRLHERISPARGEFLLTDPGGSVIYASAPPSEEFVHAALGADLSADGAATSRMALNHEPHLLVHLRSAEYGLIYSYMIPMSAVTADADFMIGIITVFVAAIILVSCVAGMLSVRRLSRPIDRIRDVINLTRNTAEPLMLPELVRQIERVYDENQSMTEHLKLYKLTQKAKFLWQLLCGPVGEDLLGEQLAHFDLPFRADDPYAVAVFSADSASGDASDKARNWELLPFYILQSLREEMEEPFRIEAVDWDDIYLILSGGEAGDSDEFMDSLLQAVSSLHQRITAEMSLSVTVGVSDLLRGVKQLPLCRRQAESARDLRWMYGFNHVLMHRQSADEASPSRYPYELEKRLCAAFKAAQEGPVFACLDEFYEYVIRNAKRDVGIGQRHFLQLLSSTYRMVYDWCDFCLEAIPTERESFSDFLAEQTADQLYERLRALYRAMLTQLEKRRCERHQNLSSEIAAYIDINYHTDLSLDSIADAFKISASHLRRVFREETGWSVKGYIDNTRIEKAKELLSQTGRLVNDIGVQTGYVSPQTFTRVFKKATGYTPGEYRRARCKNIAPIEAAR